MNALIFTIHLLEPVLVTQLGGGDPNSSHGYSFIPGSVVRGFLIDHHLQGKRIDAGDADFRRLFFNGGVRFLNAYPLDRHGVRTLPTPRSWFVEKGETDPIFDFAVEENGEPKMPKGVEEPFCRLSLDEANDTCLVTFYKPATQVNIHTYREERARVTKHKSTVFRYEAIAAGEKFGGVILANDVNDLETLRSLLTDAKFDIGGSHTAGYGHVQIEVEDTPVQPNWAEYEPMGDDANTIIVTFLSDALLRDTNGTYTTDLDQLVGKEHKQAYVKPRVVGGFNRKWGLPLLQSLAIQAGSVYVYPHSDDLLARLRTLEETGIGERRVEGFGRIAVNWHQSPRLKELPPVPRSKPLLPPLQGSSAELARQMTERMLRVKLDRALIKNINGLEIHHKPSNSQLSRIRLVTRRALAENNAVAITEHLKGMKRAARDQFNRAKVGRQRLSEWLTNRASNPQTIWDELGVSGIKKPSIGKVQPNFNNALALEYTVRLIDGVLRKATKEGK